MSVEQLNSWVKSSQADAQIEKLVKLWKAQNLAGLIDAEHTRTKIKVNHIVFTKVSKMSFAYLMKSNACLVYRNKGELLYSDKASLNKVFYIVLYGGFSLAAGDKSC